MGFSLTLVFCKFPDVESRAGREHITTDFHKVKNDALAWVNVDLQVCSHLNSFDS